MRQRRSPRHTPCSQQSPHEECMRKIANTTLFLLFVAQTACRADGTQSTGNDGGTACSTPADCPQPDKPCTAAICKGAICGMGPMAENTVLPDSAPGDCNAQICDGAGNLVARNDDSDVPEDGNFCTNDVCTSGVPSNPPAAAGTPCSEGGKTLCNGAGACVECVTVADCPGQDAACELRTCIDGVCGTAFVPAGTPSALQTPT
jgi:hypothetical protein